MQTFAAVMWETAQRLKLDPDCTKWSKLPIDKIMAEMAKDLKNAGVVMTPGMFAFDEKAGKTVGYDFSFSHWAGEGARPMCDISDGLWLRRCNIQTQVRPTDDKPVS